MENQTEQTIEEQQPVESRSAYQKRKRTEEKRSKRKSRRRIFALLSVLVVCIGVLCGGILASTVHTPYEAIQVASANVQYMKHTLADGIVHVMDKIPVDKLPWHQDETPIVPDEPPKVEPPLEESDQTIGETTTPDQDVVSTTESAVSLVTPDNPFGIDPNKPMVALTFDDGPSQYTWPIITALYEHNARATFFLVGERIASHQAAIEFTQANHNEIASHSFTHLNLAEATEEEVLQEIRRVDNVLQQQHNYTPTLFRVPYGDRSNQTLQLLRQEGKPVIGWSVDPRDWESQDKDAIVSHVLSHVKDGDIILMHDLYKSTAEAVEELVPALQAKGYQLVTVSELFQYKGIDLVPGTYYYASWKWV